MTKSDFARAIGVTPARVSQFIAEGKLHGPALDGTGRATRIVPEVARQQLRRSIDIVAGNGKHARLNAPIETPAVTSPPMEEAGPATVDLIADQIQVERLREIQARNRRTAEAEARQRGELVATATVRAGYARMATRSVAAFDGTLPAFAAGLASKFEWPARDILHALKIIWREHRAQVAQDVFREAGELPETVEIDVETLE